MSSTLRIGIIGVGKMGSHHVRLCSEMNDVELVAVCDLDEGRGNAVIQQYGGECVCDFRQLADRVDAVVIAVPTKVHREVGSFFLNKGIACLIEKPLAGTVQDADVLLEAADAGNAILQVGHVERFNPAVDVVSSLVSEPLFIDCNRISPFPFRSTDVGVVLDIMIHDIDILLYLCGSEVVSVDAVGVQVLSPSEDIANARIKFENGCVADVTASRVSLKKERQIRVFQHDSYVWLDYEERKIKKYSKRPGSENVDISKINLEEIGNPVEYVYKHLLSVEEITPVECNPLEEELRSFIKCVSDGSTPRVTGMHGRQAVAVAQTIREQLA